MAEELRGVQYQDGSAAAVSGYALLENTADKDLHIRAVHMSDMLESPNDANSETIHNQIGKNNAIDTTDGSAGVKLQKWAHSKPTATGTSGVNTSRSWYFARGQLTLEPGETLYYHKAVTGALSAYNCAVDIYYHY